jgi:hypothetical protein
VITIAGLFCGAGGSGLGASVVPDVQLRYAANHWRRAVETHAENFPDTDHDVSDISQVDPRPPHRHPLGVTGVHQPLRREGPEAAHSAAGPVRRDAARRGRRAVPGQPCGTSRGSPSTTATGPSSSRTSSTPPAG